MKRIIPLYILRELLPPFFINLLVFTFIMLMGKVLELTELVVVRGVRTAAIFKLMGLSLPFFFSMTIPMATLLSVLVVFLRLNGDQEITVLKSAGLSLYQLLPPVMVFCLWAYLLTSYLTLFLVPASNWAFRKELLELAKARADVYLKERVFNVGFKNMVIFVNHMSMNSDLMEDVFIQDDREGGVTSVIVAARGRISTDHEQGALIFQLYDGVMDRIYKTSQRTDTINFRQYELKLDVEGELSQEAQKRNQSELTTEDLWAAVQSLKEQNHEHYPIYLMDAHKRYSVPVACLVLGLVAVPLGVQFRRRGRNWGLTMGLTIFLIYYVLLTAGWSIGKGNKFPPGLGMWVPNLVVGLAALYLLRQANNEKPVKIISLINWLLDRLRLGRRH
ncbi:MAG: LPS export ABC transporter permease LptF [Thermodesulfobacteriota bacterium]